MGGWVAISAAWAVGREGQPLGGQCPLNFYAWPHTPAPQAARSQRRPAPHHSHPPAVRDDSYRSALALKGERLYTQDFEALHLTGLLAAVGRLLLPAAGPLAAKLHALNIYKAGKEIGAVSDVELP